MTYTERLKGLRKRAENITTDPLTLQWVVAELCELLAEEANPPLWNEIHAKHPTQFVEFDINNPLAAPQYEHCESDINEHYLQENDRLAKENKDLLHKVEVLAMQERTQRQRGDHWHAQWSAERRIIEAIQLAMVDATRRLHAIFGEDLTWDELLAAAADELERITVAGDEMGDEQ